MSRTSLATLVAAELRAENSRTGSNTERLARQINKSPTWLRERLTGRRSIDFDELELICGGIGLSPAKVLSAAVSRMEPVE